MILFLPAIIISNQLSMTFQTIFSISHLITNIISNPCLQEFHSQYIDQNPPQTNVFPSLNSPSIVINSPQTYVIIMPVPVVNPDIRQQDTCSNYSITDSQFRQ
ncbi:unnamed protein product [Rhizophagus irregularis]|nr:unnamed protein product [Rhizophagus irregularis]CAB5387221.1 unnamed protein product [Rhizophagus irregularis]